MSRVLFLLKRREDYNVDKHSQIGLSTGLYNSAKFIDDFMPNSKLAVVVDNNDIDREVTLYKPTHVIIEALWVVPSKFDVLQRLHPNVKWIVRLHSEMPFMAQEGIALNWIAEYARYRNVLVACNAPRMLEEVQTYVEALDLSSDKVIYLPNFYPQTYKKYERPEDSEFVNVSCFGAVRPLKNHISQAIAALKFANLIGKKLKFHVNAGRIEMNGGPIVHNLKSLFEQLSDQGHQLINHEWTPREQFLELCGQMDMGLQVSFSETFNIVGADLISQGVPVVGSKEIPWLGTNWQADPTETDDIAYTMLFTHKLARWNVFFNQRHLTKYTEKSRKIWLDYFGRT